MARSSTQPGAAQEADQPQGLRRDSFPQCTSHCERIIKSTAAADARSATFRSPCQGKALVGTCANEPKYQEQDRAFEWIAAGSTEHVSMRYKALPSRSHLFITARSFITSLSQVHLSSPR